MTKELAVTDQEKLNYLAEEIKSILTHVHEGMAVAMIAAKYMVGEAIISHQLYKKYAKGQSVLYREIFKQTDIRAETLADCVKFYETYPKKKPQKIADELYTKYGAWRNIRMALYGGNPNAVKKLEGLDCRHCPEHCPRLGTYGIK